MGRSVRPLRRKIQRRKDYLSRHLRTVTRKQCSDIKAEEEYVISQTYGLFDFIQTNGIITRYVGQSLSSQKNDQSQRNTRTRKQIQNNHSLEEGTPQNNINSIQTSNQPSTFKMDQSNGIHMEFIFKKRGHSPETDRL